jgi:phosphatidylglycerophosphate synthase
MFGKLTFKNFNIADWISFYRIAIAPVLLIFIYYDERLIFSFFLLVSYSTDMVDGFVARKLKMTSQRGSQLDSMGDQITLIIGLIGIYTFEYDFINRHYILIALSLGLYMSQMFIAWRKYGKATAFHTYLAKLSALAQGVFILLLLFFGSIEWLFYLMIGLGIIETLEEITLIFLFDNWRSDIKGLYWVLKKNRNEHETALKPNRS